MLGQWEDGLRNYQMACKLDYDETVDEWMREIKPKVRETGGERRGGGEEGERRREGERGGEGKQGRRRGWERGVRWQGVERGWEERREEIMEGEWRSREGIG